MDQFFEYLSDYVQDHWIKFLTAGGFMAVGWFFGKRRARSNWQRREFYDRLNISLNMLEDGKLLIRTLVEKNSSDIFLNTAAVEAVTAAARKTTPADPVLPLPESEYWYYLNPVLNEISEKFAQGQIRRDLGAPVARETYVMTLTCEAAGEVRTRKVRAMLIKKKHFENLPETPPTFESPHHSVRWDTLKKLAAEYKARPQKFLTVEICV